MLCSELAGICDSCGNYSRFRKLNCQAVGTKLKQSCFAQHPGWGDLPFHGREEFQFCRCRSRLKHYTFDTGLQVVADPVSSGVYVHAESYKSWSSKAVLGDDFIEYTSQRKWEQMAMPPVVFCRTRRVRNLCILLSECHHHNKGEGCGISHEKRCFYSILYHTY